MAISYTGKTCKYCANAGVVQFGGLCGSCETETRTNYSEHLWCRFCGRANIRDRNSNDELTCGMPVCEQTRRGEMTQRQLVETLIDQTTKAIKSVQASRMTLKTIS